MKIETTGNQYFSVPNDSEGRLFIKQLRKNLNRKKYKIALMGRGSRQVHGNSRNIAPKNSEWIAVYIRQKPQKIEKGV